MANTRLGGVFMKDTDGNIARGSAESTENICGIIFDINGFEVDLAGTQFANGTVVELNTTKDIETAGITKTLMGGLVDYHIRMFFSLAGQNKRLFVSFMNSETDAEFEAIQLLQSAADGLIYQIGVWTAQPTAKIKDASKSKEASTLTADDYEMTGLYGKLQAVAETLGGKIGEVNYDGNSPINIIINAPVVSDLTMNYQNLPDISELDLPKLSHILGQESSDGVHAIQASLITSLGGSKMAVVGNIGAAMGVLAVAPADISIAYVKNYNLAGVMQSCELGFGEIAVEGGKFTASSAFNNIRSITYSKRNDKLHAKGYIFLTPIEGIANGVFFSSDQTLSTGDYRTISRCRVMHKSRRVVRQALLAKVNAPVLLDTDTGEMSASDIASYQNLVLEALDNNMYEPGTTTPQISGRSCYIEPNQNILANDKIDIEYWLVPIGCTSAIFVTEGFVGSVSE